MCRVFNGEVCCVLSCVLCAGDRLHRIHRTTGGIHYGAYLSMRSSGFTVATLCYIHRGDQAYVLRGLIHYPANELRRISLPGTWVNKPPADAPEAAGWHHAHGVDPLEKHQLAGRREACRWMRTRP